MKENRSRKFHLFSIDAAAYLFCCIHWVIFPSAVVAVAIVWIEYMELKLYFHDFWCWKFVKENILWYSFCRIHTHPNQIRTNECTHFADIVNRIVQKFMRLQFPHSFQLISFHLMNVTCNIIPHSEYEMTNQRMNESGKTTYNFIFKKSMKLNCFELAIKFLLLNGWKNERSACSTLNASDEWTEKKKTWT